MKNSINYYYNLRINDLIKKKNWYYFFLNDDEYIFINFDRPIGDIVPLYYLNNEMLKRGCLVHKIILNKDKNPITTINDDKFLLLKLCKYKNNRVFLNDIVYLQNMTYNINSHKDLFRLDWVKLWSEKIDYYEYQINQLGKNYPILCDSLGYYIGLGENAISYLVNNNYKNIQPYVVSHKRIYINKGSLDFFNPLNFIIDNRVRDICEYIKNTFFYDDFNEFELKSYFNNCNYNKDEYIYLFSRLLFPTYYFDVYDKIINKKCNEEIIIPIIKKSVEYEIFLKDIYNYITNEKKVQIEPIDWLMKNNS